MGRRVTALVCIAMLGGCLDTQVSLPGSARGAPEQAAANGPAVAVVAQGIAALTTSMRAKRLALLDAATTKDTVTVEYRSSARASGASEKAELAYVLVAAAVAFPYATTVQANRVVGTAPRVQVRAPSIEALRVASGDRPYDPWVAALSPRRLTAADALTRPD